MLFARHRMMNAGPDDAQQLEAAHELNDEEEETPGGCILAHSMVRLSNIWKHDVISCQLRHHCLAAFLPVTFGTAS